MQYKELYTIPSFKGNEKIAEQLIIIAVKRIGIDNMSKEFLQVYEEECNKYYDRQTKERLKNEASK